MSINNNFNNNLDSWDLFLLNEKRFPGENFSCYNCKKFEHCKNPTFNHICEDYVKRS